MFPQAFKKTRRLLFTVNELAGFQSEITVICLERIIIISCIYFISIVLQIEKFTFKITHQTVWFAVTVNFTRLRVGRFSWLSEGLFIQLLYRAMKNWARKYMSQKTFTMWALNVACLILPNSAAVISIGYGCSKNKLKNHWNTFFFKRAALFISRSVMTSALMFTMIFYLRTEKIKTEILLLKRQWERSLRKAILHWWMLQHNLVFASFFSEKIRYFLL